MNLVKQIHINKNHPAYNQFDDMALNSKHLFNSANYIIRQSFINDKKYINNAELYHIVKLIPEYNFLPTKLSCQVLLQLKNCWKGFFEANKAFKKNPNIFTGKPKLPNYKDKDGRNIITFPLQSISIPKLKKGIIKLCNIDFEFTTELKDIRQVRIIPDSDRYIMEIIYNKQEVDFNLNKDNVIGIDLGVNNLVAITSNQSRNPVLINGRQLKSINQFYNKSIANLKSLLPLDKYSSKNIRRITYKRNNKVKHFLHHVSKYIIDYCISNDIGTIVIGKNDNWKQDINIGKRNNQNFVQIPHYKLIQQIQYKAALVGINVLMQEESYTSKCSFLDNEEICKHSNYLGKRIKRGLFKSFSGKLINADINGSFNIIRKAFPNIFKNNGIEGIRVYPLMLTNLALQKIA